MSRVTAYPGADIGSDHNPLVADFRFRCKLLIEKSRGQTYNIQNLRQPRTNPNQQNVSNEIWNTLETSIQIATKNVLEKQRREKIKPWMNDEILNLMNERRLAKDQRHLMEQ